MVVTKYVRLEDLTQELQAIPGKIAESVDENLGLERMLQWAKIFCPVITGALRESIRALRMGKSETWLIAGGWEYTNPVTGKPVTYARAVHDGTMFQVAQPFLLMAMEMDRHQLAERIKEGTLEKI